jgi:hypothetical protein
MLYLTRSRLMRVSEDTVQQQAAYGDTVLGPVCSALLADEPRYALWRARHGREMDAVAGAGGQEQQVLALRAVAVRQVQGTALGAYLRTQLLSDEERIDTLREFYSVTDVRTSAVAEDRNYLIAASSRLCATVLLEMSGDDAGVRLIEEYERAYHHYFAAFCDTARAESRRQRYLLEPLIPELRANAERLRRRALEGEALPLRLIAFNLVSHG